MLRAAAGLLLATLLVPLFAGPAGAQPTDPVELERFIDGVMAGQLQAHHVPGAAVAVVRDGALLTARGYGYADLGEGIAVDPAETLFRVGSFSGVITSTAVMQQVEIGALNLDAQVNAYLTEYPLPLRMYKQPVTLGNLLTQTAGFEERTDRLYADGSEGVQPLGIYVQTNRPALVRPPGTLTSYSEYGVATAGNIMEKAAGMPFDSYVDAKILTPLGMDRSSFAQPPGGLTDSVASGYLYSEGAYRKAGFEWARPVPALAMSSTANDLASFGIAMLQLGAFEDGRILEEDTAVRMQTQLFTNDPRLPGWTPAFMEMAVNGRRVLWMSCDTEVFSGGFYLVPDEGVALVALYNSPGGKEGRDELLEAFMDRYFPVESPAVPGVAAAKTSRFVSGHYTPARSAYKTLEKLDRFNSTVGMCTGLSGGGTTFGPDGAKDRWVRTADDFFERADGAFGIRGAIAFRPDTWAQATYMLYYNDPSGGYVKQKWFEDVDFQRGVAWAMAAVFASMLVFGPAALIYNRRRRRSSGVPPRLAGIARLLAWITCLLDLGFLAWVLWMVRSSDYTVTAFSKTMLVIPIAATVLAGLVLVLAVVAWALRFWKPIGRAYYSLVALALLAFIWWTAFWNLWGFKY
ncbi:MAG: beta-lactamase family protein [Actinobacteria bacterium]|nr:beta-lactamase family protein [Actinomycetota bacterium]MBU1942537.1 beta-lactamase family protein [Actinomycetota bacterium]MBU2687218.1 beta-lactamase family protein [Actinomycetota bacterium]